MRSDAIERLILDIHAAPLDEGKWAGVARTLCGLVGAERAMLFSVPMGRCGAFWNVLSELDPQMPRDYAAEFAPEDPWALAARQLPASMAGRIVTGDELIARGEFLRTRFFNEFAVPHGIDRFLCALLRDPAYPGAAPGAAFSFYRSPGSDDFDSTKRAVLARLVPHLVVALDTFWRLRALTIRNVALTAGLDAVAAAVIIIDCNGRVVFENSAAQTLLRRGDCLEVIKGRLEPSKNVRERQRCRDALVGLLEGRAATVRLTGVHSKSTAMLSTAPFTSASDCGPWEGAAGLVWLVPSATARSAVGRVAKLFMLTAAEERLLGQLSADMPLAVAAAASNISIHTVRNQLKAIQRKTGWRTQGELLRMVQQLSSISPVAE